MATKKKRVIISVSKPVEEALKTIALRDQVPQATKASELIELGLMIEEDEVWNEIVQERDTKDAKFIDHKEAWS